MISREPRAVHWAAQRAFSVTDPSPSVMLSIDVTPTEDGSKCLQASGRVASGLLGINQLEEGVYKSNNAVALS